MFWRSEVQIQGCFLLGAVRESVYVSPLALGSLLTVSMFPVELIALFMVFPCMCVSGPKIPLLVRTTLH
jgi:hypothetical protein